MQAQNGTRLLRLEGARNGLTLQRHVEAPIFASVILREWNALACEDQIGTLFRRQPRLVVAYRNMGKSAPDTAIKYTGYDLGKLDELYLVLRELLAAEDWRDVMHPDGLAAGQEFEATRSAVCRGELVVPLSLNHIWDYWIMSFELRKKRRARRVELRQRQIRK